MRKLVCILGLFIFTLLSSWAQQVKVEATIDKKSIQSGEPIQLSLSVQQSDDVVVVWPIIKDTITKYIEVIERKDVDTAFNKEKTLITYTQTIFITSFDSGMQVLPPFEFKYYQNKDTLTALTQALNVTVDVPEVDMSKEFKDIIGAQDVPFHWLEFFYYYLGAFLLILAIIAGYFIYKKIKNRPPPVVEEKPIPVIPAEVIAFEKLEIIKSQKLWQAGKIKPYYSELTAVVREYIEKRYRIDAEEMTTSEILNAIQITDATQDARLDLMKLLQLADLVKFAKGEPSDLENENAWENAHGFVDKTKMTENPPKLS